MLVIGSIVSDVTTEVGLAAGSIAVGGFLAHAMPALRGADEERLRSATVLGGLGGFLFAGLVNLGPLIFQ